MQVDIGSSHGRYINERYVRNALDRQGLRESCTKILALYIQWAPSWKYEMIELFMQAETFGHHFIRQSYLHELMATVNFGKYRKSTEDMLQVQNDDPDERILQAG